jgi:hypothetical protein
MLSCPMSCHRIFGGVKIEMGFCTGLDFAPSATRARRHTRWPLAELCRAASRPFQFRLADADHATEHCLSARVESYGRPTAITLDL